MSVPRSAKTQETQKTIAEATPPGAAAPAAAATRPPLYEVAAPDVERGLVDIQGIDWAPLPVSRAEFRATRTARYTNYANVPPEERGEPPQTTPTDASGAFFRFRYAKLRHHCSIVHFQLRNLLWATSRNDVFYTYGSTVRHWSPVSRRSSTVVDLQRTSLGAVRVSALAAKQDLLVAGGFGGQYALQPLQPVDFAAEADEGCPAVAAAVKAGLEPRDAAHFPFALLKAADAPTAATAPLLTRPAAVGHVTRDENGITNHVDLVTLRSGARAALFSSNDRFLRVLDAAAPALQAEWALPWPVNCAALAPDGRLVCAVGDAREALLIDPASGKPAAELHGHQDYSFACAWAPAGPGPGAGLLATGSQDTTTRLYDIRYTREALAVVPGRMAAVRSLRFSPDGRFLAIAESADFVHLVDLHGGAAILRTQCIDFFGEIAGISFAGAADDFCGAAVAERDAASGTLFVCNADDAYGGILEFERASARLFSGA